MAGNSKDSKILAYKDMINQLNSGIGWINSAQPKEPVWRKR